MTARSPLQTALPFVVVLTPAWGTTWILSSLAVKEVPVWTFRVVSATLARLGLLAVAALRGMRLGLTVALSALDVGLLLACSNEAYANAPLGFALGLLAAFGWAL